MSEQSDAFSYQISVNDIDTSLLPKHARTPGTDAFRTEVTKLIEKDFTGFGGHARILVTDQVVEVHYRPDPNQPDPLEVALGMLRKGKYEEGMRLLEVLHRWKPDDVDVLFNLGMACSDKGMLDRATNLLKQATTLAPRHVNAAVALGVAYSRQRRWDEAIAVLRDALLQEADNPWAHRNLGACLLQSGKKEEAEQHLRRAVEINPQDQQSVYGLAQALRGLGKEKEADELYIRVIDMDGRTPVAEEARLRRSELAHSSFRDRVEGGVRMDAVMYLLGAMQKFGNMSKTDVQKVAVEIAILGQRGIDPNDSAQKYQLRSLPGNYSGLHLLCLMFIGFRTVAPEHSIGFDLAKEYEVAKSMYSPKKKD